MTSKENSITSNEREGQMNTEQREVASVVMSVVEAGAMLGCGKNKSYDLARQGKLPGLIRLNGRMVVSKAKFLRWLNGEEENQEVRSGDEDQ